MALNTNGVKQNIAAATAYPTSVNGIVSTKQNMKNLIDEIETISKELIVQTCNSSKIKGAEPNNELNELSKLLVQKQAELDKFVEVAVEQQLVDEKINKVKTSLSAIESQIKYLITCLKEAEQILSSSVYQAKIKLDMIKKAKALPSEEIINYAYKISAENAVCCPENWVPDNPKRPYPTDADMRRGWLARIDRPDLNAQQEEAVSPKAYQQSNSQVINPIVPNDIAFKDEFMSDSDNDSLVDDD